MRVIITGGSGLIGTALTQSFVADGHEVIILTRDPARAGPKLPTGARAEQWDGRTAAGWGQLVNSSDAIVNLAGESIAGANIIAGRWTAQRKAAILNSRLNAAAAVVQAVQQAAHKPGVVLQASAVGYYGSRGDQPLPEDAGPGDDFLANVCQQWEGALKPIEALGVRTICTRSPGLTLSRRGGSLAPIKLLTNIGAGGPLGSGKQYWPWIHINDLVAAMRFLMASGFDGAANTCTPTPVRQKEFAQVLGRVMHRPSFMPAPAFAMRLVAGELAEALLLASQNMQPAALQSLNFTYQFTDLHAALDDLINKGK